MLVVNVCLSTGLKCLYPHIFTTKYLLVRQKYAPMNDNEFLCEFQLKHKKHNDPNTDQIVGAVVKSHKSVYMKRRKTRKTYFIYKACDGSHI